MKYRDILIFGEPVLKEKARPVSKIDATVKSLLKRMYAVMQVAGGVGLAAPQIGVPLRVAVIDIGEGPIYMINPVITWYSEEKCEFEEGCLSFPGVAINILRPERVRVAYVDDKGNRNVLEADGLLARAIQHEIDHLDGILIIDRATGKQRLEALSRLEENLKLIEAQGMLAKE